MSRVTNARDVQGELWLRKKRTRSCTMAGWQVSKYDLSFFCGLVLDSFQALDGFVCTFLSMDGAWLEILPPRPGGGVPISGKDAHGPPGSARSGPARSPWFSVPRVCRGHKIRSGGGGVSLGCCM